MAMNPRLLRPLATGFNPLTLSGLEAWWDFADSATVTLDSNRVSAVADKSGNGRTAANGTSGSTQPDYVTGARNGRSVARFDAALTQRLTVASSTGTFKFLHDGTAAYVAAVFSTGTVADPNGSFGILGNNATATANRGFVLQVDDRTPTFNMLLRVVVGAGVAGTWAVTQETANIFVPSQTHIAEALVDADNATATNRALTFADGAVLPATNVSTLSPSASNATFDFQIGTSGNNVTPHTGDICEILILSQQPTLAQQLALRRHLARKWGVTLA